MRKDYAYVNRATSICLCTTDKGHQWLEDNQVEDVKGEINKAIWELLALVEQDYVILESPTGITGMWIKIDEVYKEQYTSVHDITMYTVAQALIMGWWGVRKVVWD